MCHHTRVTKVEHEGVLLHERIKFPLETLVEEEKSSIDVYMVVFGLLLGDGFSHREAKFTTT